MNLEKEIKKALIDHDLTMNALADELGISTSYVSDLIKGKRSNAAQIERILNRLGLRDGGEEGGAEDDGKN